MNNNFTVMTGVSEDVKADATLLKVVINTALNKVEHGHKVVNIGFVSVDGNEYVKVETEQTK